jgi:hypothetical protein
MQVASTRVVKVNRAQVAAARLRRERDVRAGRPTDPRVEQIAEAVRRGDRVEASQTSSPGRSPSR